MASRSDLGPHPDFRFLPSMCVVCTALLLSLFYPSGHWSPCRGKPAFLSCPGSRISSAFSSAVVSMLWGHFPILASTLFLWLTILISSCPPSPPPWGSPGPPQEERMGSFSLLFVARWMDCPPPLCCNLITLSLAFKAGLGPTPSPLSLPVFHGTSQWAFPTLKRSYPLVSPLSEIHFY